MVREVTLNSDMGEGSHYDEMLLNYVDYANVAGGGHAGDVGSVELTVRLASLHGVAVGAHPSYPDRDGFGRVSLFSEIDPNVLKLSLVEQIVAVFDQSALLNVPFTHVKPHGAIYNDAMWDGEVASLVLDAIDIVREEVRERGGAEFAVMGMPGTLFEELAFSRGYTYLREGFVDRLYRPDGRLASRDTPGAVLHSVEDVTRQVYNLLNGQVETSDGSMVALEVDTLCIHSDTDGADRIAKIVYSLLGEER